MNPRVAISILIFSMLVACKKENTQNLVQTMPSRLVSELRDSMDYSNFSKLDFSRAALSTVSESEGSVSYLRIPFFGESLQSKFAVVRADVNQHIKKGRIVRISGRVNEHHQFNGEVWFSDLRDVGMMNSIISDGHIQAFLPNEAITRVGDLMIVVVPKDYLPEVVIVGTLSMSNAQSWTTWMSLQGMLGESTIGSTGVYGSTSAMGVSGGGAVSSTSGTGGSTTVLPEGVSGVSSSAIEIDFETQFANQAIDLEKYLKCFDLIPDATATGSIELLCDIPVDKNPSKIFDWSNGSPGHSFIRLTKKSGTTSISQIIGFYPNSSVKIAFTNAPVSGKFVDNSGHEFNASYSVELTATQIRSAITRMLYLKGFVKYDIDDYNCTDWALDVFNNTVKVDQRLVIPHYQIPGGQAPNGTSTPNGVYNLLTELKKSNGPEAKNILIPLAGYAGESHGECN